VTCGEPRIARSTLTPVLVPPACAGFPNRDIELSRHLFELALWSLVAIDETRVLEPSEGRVPWCSDLNDRVRVLGLRTLTTFPSSAFEGHPLVVGAGFVRGGDPCEETDRPRSSFRRRPAKDFAIPKFWVPFTVAMGVLRGLAPPASLFGVSLTPPTLFPQPGESACLGIASAQHELLVVSFRERVRLWCLLCTPGTDDPSMPA
jgi:hypothetical protein